MIINVSKILSILMLLGFVAGASHKHGEPLPPGKKIYLAAEYAATPLRVEKSPANANPLLAKRFGGRCPTLSKICDSDYCCPNLDTCCHTGDGSCCPFLHDCCEGGCCPEGSFCDPERRGDPKPCTCSTESSACSDGGGSGGSIGGSAVTTEAFYYSLLVGGLGYLWNLV